MALHFSAEEFAERRRRTPAAMAEAKLDGLLMFRQESMYSSRATTPSATSSGSSSMPSAASP